MHKRKSGRVAPAVDAQIYTALMIAEGLRYVKGNLVRRKGMKPFEAPFVSQGKQDKPGRRRSGAGKSKPAPFSRRIIRDAKSADKAKPKELRHPAERRVSGRFPCGGRSEEPE